MSKLALKYVNNAIFKQIYTLKLLIAFKMAYSCCFSFGGNLDFLELLQKSFITTTGLKKAFCNCLRRCRDSRHKNRKVKAVQEMKNGRI